MTVKMISGMARTFFSLWRKKLKRMGLAGLKRGWDQNNGCGGEEKYSWLFFYHSQNVRLGRQWEKLKKQTKNVL